MYRGVSLGAVGGSLEGGRRVILLSPDLGLTKRVLGAIGGS